MKSAVSSLKDFCAQRDLLRGIDEQRRILAESIEVAKGDPGVAGAKGEKGEKGDKGDKPAHQWNGTQLRFEKPDGTWGRFVDLRGPKGRGGGGGGIATAFDPTTLPILDTDPLISDYLVLERDGVAYRVSIQALQTLLGGGTQPGLNDVTVNGEAVVVNGNTVQAT